MLGWWVFLIQIYGINVYLLKIFYSKCKIRKKSISIDCLSTYENWPHRRQGILLCRVVGLLWNSSHSTWCEWTLNECNLSLCIFFILCSVWIAQDCDQLRVKWQFLFKAYSNPFILIKGITSVCPISWHALILFPAIQWCSLEFSHTLCVKEELLGAVVLGDVPMSLGRGHPATNLARILQAWWWFHREY